MPPINVVTIQTLHPSYLLCCHLSKKGVFQEKKPNWVEIKEGREEKKERGLTGKNEREEKKKLCLRVHLFSNNSQNRERLAHFKVSYLKRYPVLSSYIISENKFR